MRPAHMPSSTSVTVEAIHLGAPKVPELWAVESVRAVAGKGLEGDRHFHADGAKPGQALTLVEAEVVEGAGLPPGATRRQVTVRGVSLNDLVGKRFRVGEVECYGVELCEPCAHLESMTRPGIIKELVHRAGINADVLTDGTIAIGDEVIELSR
jgi:MOSC domain-containing protein YiiM